MKIKNCCYCSGSSFRKNGKDTNQNQRYQCLNVKCGKTFTEKSFETKEALLKKLLGLHLLLLGYDEKKIAKKINLPEQTIIDWKHKFFINLKAPQSKKLLNINECVSSIKSLQKGVNPKLVLTKKAPPKKRPLGGAKAKKAPPKKATKKK